MAESETLSTLARAAAILKAELAGLDEETRATELSVRKLAVTEGTSAEALKAAKQAAAQLKVANEERKQDLQQQVKALEAQKRAQEEASGSAKTMGSVVGLALRAISGGSGELVERFTKIKDGFKVAGDSSQSMGTRMAAGAASAALTGEAIAQLGEKAIQTAQQMMEYARVLNEAAVAQDLVARQARAVGSGLAAVQTATNGAMGLTEAYAMRQALLREHLTANEHTYGELAAAARQYAQAEGVTATEAAQRLTEAIISGDRATLAHFQVAAQGSTAQQRLNALHFEGARAQLTEAEAANRRSEALQRAYREQGGFSGMVATYNPIVRAQVALINLATDALVQEQGATDRANAATRTATQARNESAAAAQAEAQRLGELAQRAKDAQRAFLDLNTAQGQFSAEARHGETMAGRLERRFTGLLRVVGEQSDQRRENQELLRRFARSGADRRQMALARGQLGIEDTGPAALQAAKEADRNREETLQRALGLELQIADVSRNRGESEVRYNQRVQAYLARTIEAYQEQVRLIDQGLSHVRDTEEQRRTFERDLAGLSGGYSTNEAGAGVETAALERQRGRVRSLDEYRLRREQHLFERETQDNPGGVNVAARLAQLEAQSTSLDAQLAEAQRRAAAPGASEADQAAVEALQRRYDLVQQNIQATREFTDAQRDANNVGLQTGRAFSQSFQLQTSSAQRFAQTASGAVEQLTGAFTNHLEALAEGRESGQQALRGMAQDLFKYLAEVGIKNALFETAAGIAALASYQYPSAALHFAAAGGYAVLAGVGLGGSAALASGSPSGSAAAPSGAREPASSGGGQRDQGGGSINLTFNYGGGRPFATTREMEHFQRRAIDAAARALDVRRAA